MYIALSLLNYYNFKSLAILGAPHCRLGATIPIHGRAFIPIHG